jgi:NAD(P)-dependent dehydrogenase (short-subunit alcohol dehydrogenase family)
MTSIPGNFIATPELLNDQVILVTGATGGFGKAVSTALARHGATVILLARNLRLVEALYDEIEQAGGPTPAIYPMNLEGATEHDYAELANNLESRLGRLDGMIHCAATLGAPTVFAQSDATTWYQVHQVKAYWDAYQVSKQGLAAMAGLLAREYEGSNLHVNCFNPGKTRTALQLRAYPAAHNNDQLPLPQEHLNTFLYLMSAAAKENGQIFSP